mgnify:FL=1
MTRPSHPAPSGGPLPCALPGLRGPARLPGVGALLVLGTLALLGLVLLPGAAAAQQVQGRLLDDADARPLAGAWVTLVRDGENVARAVTRVDGGFRIIAPTPGRYLLRADFLGYGTVERDVDIPPPGEPDRKSTRLNSSHYS